MKNTLVQFLYRSLNDDMLVIGPELWQPSDGETARQWYFIVAARRAGRFTLDQIIIPEPGYRAVVLAALIQGPAVIIHLMEDELDMAKLCEQLWPSARTRRLRPTIEKERAA